MLALRELEVHQKGLNLRDIILDEPEEYGIPIENVYSITSDNGTNMILAGHLLNPLVQELEEEDPQTEEDQEEEEEELDHDDQEEGVRRDEEEENYELKEQTEDSDPIASINLGVGVLKTVSAALLSPCLVYII